jgi:mono/diheme cytochrome c family protein
MGDLKVKELEKDQFLTVNSALQSQALKILDTSCKSCHSADTVSGGVSDINNVKYLVNSKLIVPGDPQQGRLVGVIEEGTMPKASGQALSAKQIATIKAWITSMSWVQLP